MPRVYLACLVALGASSCPCAESAKIGLAEFTTRLEGQSCSSREEFALLQHHARQQEASQLYERDAVAGAPPSSSRKDRELAEDESLFAFYGGYAGGQASKCERFRGAHEGIDHFDRCGCYHANATTVRPNGKPAVYRFWTMWKPQPAATVFNEVQQHHVLRDAAMRGMIPGIAYNPSIQPIPSGLAASWHPDAHYVAVTRHYLGEEECRVKTEGSDYAWTGSDFSSVALLNQNLETLVVGKLPLPIEDYRLFAFQGKVLVTANSVNRTTNDPRKLWSYRVFELGLEFTRHDGNADQQCPEQLKVLLKEFEHNGVSDFDHEKSLSRFYGKNIGLVSNGKDEELHLLWRLSNPAAIMPWSSKILFTEIGSSALRNNGNPVYLPEHDAYLAIGHTFWEGNASFQHHYHFVRNYIHRIVLFDANPPYHWLRASKPLCLPAISGMNKSESSHLLSREEVCESIQFIMSWFREGDDIVITYGVTDCEPAVARVPLMALLEATSADFAVHPEPPHDKDSFVVEGEWKLDTDEDRVVLGASEGLF